MGIDFKSGQWYLAGPFFNAVQKSWAEELRDLMIDQDLLYYAPVEHMFQGGIHDKKKADVVFKDNVSNLERSSVVLCQLDWQLPENREVRLIKAPVISGRGSVVSPALSIPDSGTVWEMGYAAAIRAELDIAVIGYTAEKTDKLNLMLARSCDAFYDGKEALVEFIKRGTILGRDTFKGGML